MKDVITLVPCFQHLRHWSVHRHLFFLFFFFIKEIISNKVQAVHFNTTKHAIIKVTDPSG